MKELTLTSASKFWIERGAGSWISVLAMYRVHCRSSEDTTETMAALVTAGWGRWMAAPRERALYHNFVKTKYQGGTHTHDDNSTRIPRELWAFEASTDAAQLGIQSVPASGGTISSHTRKTYPNAYR